MLRHVVEDVSTRSKRLTQSALDARRYIRNPYHEMLWKLCSSDNAN